VPGTVWVGRQTGVWAAVGVFKALADARCAPTLNVDVEAVAWWVECKYGEALVLVGTAWGSSGRERELMVSFSSSSNFANKRLDAAVEYVEARLCRPRCAMVI